MGSGERLDTEYQDLYRLQNFIGDGSTTTFLTDSFPAVGYTTPDSTTPVIVLVGGTVVDSSLYTVDATNPVQVTFATAPADGYQVRIQVEQGKSWYAPGSTTPSNGVPLQKQTTTVLVVCALFENLCFFICSLLPYIT